MSLSPQSTVCLRAGASARIVALDDLRLIAARDNYSEITLADGSAIVIRKSLKSWQAALPSTHFLRVHRTLIVNLSSVVRYERDAADRTSLYLAGFERPVRASRRTWPQLRDRFASLHTVL